MLRAVFGFVFGCLVSSIVVWILIENDVDTLVIAPDAVMPDNSRYYGDIADGKFHGKGRLISSNGLRYEGDFVEGLLSGRGELEYESGEYYRGEFENGYMNGRGIFKDSSGGTYEGEFLNNEFHGQGTYLSSRNETYSGEYDKGRFTGEGKYDDGKGNRYVGGFLNWVFHGKGKHERDNGDVYEGDFDNGKFEGVGKLVDSDKNIFAGKFADWQLHGEGSLSMADGNKYIGRFEMGVLNGAGEFHAKDGDVYKGEFKDWMYHGKGILIEKDGTTYQGRFENGYKHGQGVLTFAEPVNGVTEKKGEWRYNSFVDPDAARREKELRRNVENVIYSQNETLNDYLAALQAGTAGKPEFYFLGIAAGGDQDVFIKEVRFIKSSLDQRFNMGGRSILLSNNQDTLAEFPLATKTSIRSALETIARKMNPDEDILMLYITSHGSQTHEISLDNPGFTLAGIGANELAGLLREYPVKWKIVAVSACYAGGFIPALKDDNSLIMTAAREDRKSFGCSNTSEMTYFGKAYFKEALPESESFVQAFDKAKLLIKEWEDKDIEQDPDAEYSEPQIYIGKNMESYLQQQWHDM